jgi:hypothetical protein
VSEANKAIVRRLVDEVMNAGRLDVIDAALSTAAVDHPHLRMHALHSSTLPPPGQRTKIMRSQHPFCAAWQARWRHSCNTDRVSHHSLNDQGGPVNRRIGPRWVSRCGDVVAGAAIDLERRSGVACWTRVTRGRRRVGRPLPQEWLRTYPVGSLRRRLCRGRRERGCRSRRNPKVITRSSSSHAYFDTLSTVSPTS